MIPWSIIAVLWILGWYTLCLLLELWMVSGYARGPMPATRRWMWGIAFVAWPFIILAVIFAKQEKKRV